MDHVNTDKINIPKPNVVQKRAILLFINIACFESSVLLSILCLNVARLAHKTLCSYQSIQISQAGENEVLQNLCLQLVI